MNAPATTLRQLRCSHHPLREASARCPECKRYYCRECITEHDDRVLCASCLAKTAVQKDLAPSRFALAPRLLLALTALIVIALVFVLIGNTLLSIPSQYHVTGGW